MLLWGGSAGEKVGNGASTRATTGQSVPVPQRYGFREARDRTGWTVGGEDEVWKGAGAETEGGVRAGKRGIRMSHGAVGGVRDGAGSDDSGGWVAGRQSQQAAHDGVPRGNWSEGREEREGEGEWEAWGPAMARNTKAVSGAEEDGGMGLPQRIVSLLLQGTGASSSSSSSSEGGHSPHRGPTGSDGRGRDVRSQGQGRRGGRSQGGGSHRMAGRRRLLDGDGSEGGNGSHDVSTGGGDPGGSRDGNPEASGSSLEQGGMGGHGGMGGRGVWADGFRRHVRRAGDNCWSQWEMRMYVTRPDRQLPPSLALRRRLSEYRRMHRRCTQVADWHAFYRHPSAGWRDGMQALGDCKYLLYLPPSRHGVGNRIMALMSAFSYALLTNRTLLISPDSFIHRFFCEPFAGSSWTIPLDAFNAISGSVHGSIARNRGLVNGWDGHDVSMHMSWDTKADAWGMFCEAEQREMAGAPFATLYTDYFLVPHFYMVPMLQVQLDHLFPDRRVFTHLSRYLLHPANYLWDRITRLFHGHLAHHALTVGLQIRAFEETPEDLMGNVFECATNIARVLPPVMPTYQWRDSAASVSDEALLGVRGRSIGALVASLNPSHAAKLRDRYMLGKPLDGSSVSVLSLSGEGEEKKEDLLHYELALTEMWLLAFCDVLLVTDTSTFGYVAAGLAGVTPFTMNVAKWKHTDWRSNARPACMLGSSEPCYVHQVEESVQCPGEPEKRPLENVPHIRGCHATGVGLTTNLPPLLPDASQAGAAAEYRQLTDGPAHAAGAGVAGGGGSARAEGFGQLQTTEGGGQEGPGGGEQGGGHGAGGAPDGDPYFLAEEQV
ncbi:hypothetical protein CLOM_g16589 [Closterium sp. NIES-68]|nr:hypothetical protein CLOM_g16589 [Closterium sp. NIES-68]